jgi:hypothetical protein
MKLLATIRCGNFRYDTLFIIFFIIPPGIRPVWPIMGIKQISHHFRGLVSLSGLKCHFFYPVTLILSTCFFPVYCVILYNFFVKFHTLLFLNVFCD